MGKSSTARPLILVFFVIDISLLPPLRERRNVIPLLIRYFCSTQGADKITFDKDAFETLVRYQWPGNVRELENTVERSLIMRNGEVISDSCDCLTRGILSSSWSAKLWSWPWNETGGTRPPLPDF
jgi:DNA-binding NtrC family response regulator